MRQEAREAKLALNQLQQEHAKLQENLSGIRNDYFKMEREKNEEEAQWRLESATSWAVGWTDHKRFAEEAYPDLAFNFELPSQVEDESGSEDGEVRPPTAEVSEPVSAPPAEAPTSAADATAEVAPTSNLPAAAALPPADADLPAAGPPPEVELQQPPPSEATPAPELPPPELPAPPTIVDLIDP